MLPKPNKALKIIGTRRRSYQQCCTDRQRMALVKSYLSNEPYDHHPMVSKSNPRPGSKPGSRAHNQALILRGRLSVPWERGPAESCGCVCISKHILRIIDGLATRRQVRIANAPPTEQANRHNHSSPENAHVSPKCPRGSPRRACSYAAARADSRCMNSQNRWREAKLRLRDSPVVAHKSLVCS